MNNPYEHAARYEKARRLADTLHAWDIGSDAARGLTDAQWAAVAKAAGVNPPSETTQSVAIGMMIGREAKQLQGLELRRTA